MYQYGQFRPGGARTVIARNAANGPLLCGGCTVSYDKTKALPTETRAMRITTAATRLRGGVTVFVHQPAAIVLPPRN